MKQIIISLIALCFTYSCIAHTDKSIQQKDGRMIGLPEKYSPAIFNWETKILRIGGNQVNLATLDNIIPFEQKYEIDVVSSWYHDTSTLPPYIGLKLKPADQSFTYSLLFNLDTLELLKVSIKYRIHQGKNAKYINHELKIDELDTEHIRALTTQIE